MSKYAGGCFQKRYHGRALTVLIQNRQDILVIPQNKTTYQKPTVFPYILKTASTLFKKSKAVSSGPGGFCCVGPRPAMEPNPTWIHLHFGRPGHVSGPYILKILINPQDLGLGRQILRTLRPIHTMYMKSSKIILT